MKIIKYKKCKNKYKVYFDDESTLDLYENVILKHDLLLKKEIDNKKLELIKTDNEKEEIYDVALKYYSIKMRTKNELVIYLKKKNYSDNDIDNTINRLLKEGIINDERYAKAYINDKFNLSSSGPNKIKNELLKNGIDESIINNYLDEINREDIDLKLDRLIDKKIKVTKNCSGNVLKYKIMNYFINEGYDKNDVERILNNKNLNSGDIKKEYDKLYNKYSKKYSGYELENIIKQKLYQKGYNLNEIKKEY